MGEKRMRDQPLSCKVEGDEVVIRIGIDTLAWAAQSERRDTPFWVYEWEKAEYVPRWKVIDNLEWAKDVVREINDEAEDGSSLLTNLLDKASENALKGGSIVAPDDLTVAQLKDFLTASGGAVYLRKDNKLVWVSGRSK